MPDFPQAAEVFDAPYYFVLSTGRTGTAYLTELLAAEPSFLVQHAPRPELEYLSSLVHRTEPSPEALELAVLAARFELFVDALRRGRTYVETNNRITFFADALAGLMPNARFIHLVRHPADFVRSGMRRGYYDPANTQHQRLRPDLHDWSRFNRLEKTAWEWNEINQHVERFKARVESKRVHTVRSEDLFRDPTARADVVRFVTQHDPATFKKLRRASLPAKPVNKQRSGSFPAYAEWTERDKASLRAMATSAPTYGYELD